VQHIVVVAATIDSREIAGVDRTEVPVAGGGDRLSELAGDEVRVLSYQLRSWPRVIP